MFTALCVDDEDLLLSALVKAVEASPDVSKTVSYTKCSQALEWANNNKPDVAFLDIHMRGMDGFQLAEKLLTIYPSLPVVFCTGFDDHAVEAFKLHAAGYIMKPVKAADIQMEIEHIKQMYFANEPQSENKLKVHCFGNFEVFANGEAVAFKRKRSKELLAYLIDRRGARVSAKEICNALWEDDGALQNNIMYFYKLLADLRKSLSDVGMEDVLIKGSQDYAVNTSKIDCDFYSYLDGTLPSNTFYGEYMSQYSWAEDTLGMLENENY